MPHGRLNSPSPLALAPERQQEPSVRGELLHPVVVGVRHVHVVVRVERQARRGVQLALAGSVLAPRGQQRALPVEHRDAVGRLVAHVHPPPAVQVARRRPHELPGARPVRRERPVVLAVDVAHGHPHAPRHVLQRPVRDVHPPVLGDANVGGRIEPPPLHRRHPQRHAVFKDLDLRNVLHCRHGLFIVCICRD